MKLNTATHGCDPQRYRALDTPYSDQEYINLACLVDPGRKLSFDSQKLQSQTVQVTIQSYDLPPGRSLSDCKPKNQLKDNNSVVMEIFKDWLKCYLDFFDPGYYEYIMTELEGTKVMVLPGHIASDNIHDYQFQGKLEHHTGIVPLTKGHKPLVLCIAYAKEYATEATKSESTTHREYKIGKTAWECNPGGNFDKVPFPQVYYNKESLRSEPKSDDSEDDKKPPAHLKHNYQIRGLRAEVTKAQKGDKKKYQQYNKKAENDGFNTRFLGLQNGKYVALANDWVYKEIDNAVITEAIRRGNHPLIGVKKSCVKLPPGDTRDDDPPSSLWDNSSGFNYYYQGNLNNCLMGEFANAISKMMGPAVAEQLLSNWNSQIMYPRVGGRNFTITQSRF